MDPQTRLNLQRKELEERYTPIMRDPNWKIEYPVSKHTEPKQEDEKPCQTKL